MARSNAQIDWSRSPPVAGAKIWYADGTTKNTDDEKNWRKWPRTGILVVIIFHRDPKKPDADYRTIEVGYDNFRVPGMPANMGDLLGEWISDEDYFPVVAAARADSWRPA